MNSEKISQKHDNIFYLKIFLLGVLALIAISIAIRCVILVRDSRFTASSFSALILGKDAYIVRVDRSSGLIAALTIHGARNVFAKNNILVNSILIGIPLEGEIIQNADDVYSHPSQQYFSIVNMFSTVARQGQYSFRDMNLYDAIKMYIVAKGVSNTSISEQSVAKIPIDNSILFDLFKDPQVLNQKTSVEVINASNTQGFASRVAQMLTNGGYNVVSVLSAEDTPHSKIIYRIKPNDSLTHLFNIFPFPHSYKDETYISDVTIVLGEDIASKVPQEE